nr:hyp [Cotesia vestalis bracovirus]
MYKALEGWSPFIKINLVLSHCVLCSVNLGLSVRIVRVELISCVANRALLPNNQPYLNIEAILLQEVSATLVLHMIRFKHFNLQKRLNCNH